MTQDVLEKYTELLANKSHNLVNGDEEIKKQSLLTSKHLFDRGLQDEENSFKHINDILETFKVPSTVIETRQKRKRDEEAPSMKIEPTPLDELFIDGFTNDQIYHQLDLRASVISSLVEKLVDASDATDIPEDDDDESDDSINNNIEDEEDINLDNLSPEEIQALKDEGLLDDDEDDDDDDEDEDSEDEESESEADDDPTIGEISYQQLNDVDQDNDSEDDDDDTTTSKQKVPKKDVWGLDDAFFSIDDFNKLTEDQEINDRLRSRSTDDDDEDEEEEEDVDIFSADAAAQLEDDDENANDIYFNDFFAPPRKGWSHNGKPSYSLSDPHPTKKEKSKQEKKKKEKRRSSVRFDDSVKVQKIKNKSRASMRDEDDDEDEDEDDDDDDEVVLDENDLADGDILDEDALGESVGKFDDEDMEEDGEEDSEGDDGEEEEDEEDQDDQAVGQQTMEKFNSDLFAEEEEDDEDADEAPASAHGRRRAALARQIADLEDENVADKEWTLKGEVTSKARPENSLLAEDLDFETTAKVVPENTEEKTQSLEDLIKKRIIEENFNDVERVTQVNDKPFLPSRLFELSDQQSSQGLGDLYANDYAGTSQNPDDKLAKEHKEIDEMWNQLSSKLDALSNAHFTPKAPKATIETVSNTPSISLENALPTAQNSSTVAAPEEVYSANKFGNVAKDEMTPEEKRAQRNKIRKSRAKDRQKIASVVDDKSRKQRMTVADEKREALKKLTQGKGVTVVGKGKVDNKKKKGNSETGKNAAGLKL